MDQFRLMDERSVKIAPHQPTDTRGKERVDDDAGGRAVIGPVIG